MDPCGAMEPLLLLQRCFITFVAEFLFYTKKISHLFKAGRYCPSIFFFVDRVVGAIFISIFIIRFS